MITKIIAKNFKGTDSEIGTGRLNLLVGPNGSGKSSVSIAAELSIHGHVRVPDKAQPIKRPADIYDAFASHGENVMEVGIEVDGKVVFSRRFRRSGDKTTQVKLINGQKFSDIDFMKSMYANGNPSVFNIASFMSLSDIKKIEEIFEKFSPPDGDIHSLEADINTLLAKEKKMKNGISALDATVFSNKDFLESNGFDTNDLESVTEKIDRELSELEDELAKIKLAELAVSDGHKSVGENTYEPGVRIQGPQVRDEKAEPKNISHRGKAFLELRDSVQKAIDAMAEVGCACASRIILKKAVSNRMEGTDGE